MESQRLREGLQAGWASVAANCVFAVVKLAAGVVGNSYALIADATESLVDVAGSLALVGALRYAAKSPDDDHPYGHGKAEPLMAAGIAILMLFAAVVIAKECLVLIVTPHPVPAAWTLAVLALVVVSKELLYRWIAGVGGRTDNQALSADAWHHRGDAMTSFAAAVGIAIALWGGPAYAAADDWAALATCLLIAWNAYQLMRPAIADIMDAAPSEDVFAQVRSVAAAVPGVLGLDKCHVRRYGPALMVDLHVLVPADMTVRDAHAIAHAVKDALRAAHPGVADVLIHIEPFESPPPAAVPDGS